MGSVEPAPYFPLPGGLADARGTARAVFDRVAGLYDAGRPGYPSDAIADLGARCALRSGSRVLEVGCGTGQATRALAGIGCAVRALELGAQLARLAAENLASFPDVEIVTTAFEDAVESPGSYDAVVSATAFHWIDPSLAFPKAATLLRPGGSLALLTNAHVAGGTQNAIAGEVQAVHRRVAPDVGTCTFPSVDDLRRWASADGDIAAVWSRVERKMAEPPPVDHLFAPPVVSCYPWIADYDRDGYLTMLSTQSTYALMDPARREELLGAIGSVIDDRLGGTITKQYVCILVTAWVMGR